MDQSSLQARKKVHTGRYSMLLNTVACSVSGSGRMLSVESRIARVGGVDRMLRLPQAELRFWRSSVSSVHGTGLVVLNGKW